MVANRTVEGYPFEEFKYCGCGCGFTLAKYNKWGKERFYIKGHVWIGRKHKSESKQKLSEFRKGKEGYWLGKQIPRESVEKQIQTKKERYVKEKHPMFGKKHSEESKQKIAKTRTKPIDQRPIIYKQGYRYLLKPDHPNADCDGRVAEHVFIMSEILGRPLEKGEHVHHKNISNLSRYENRHDNRKENLELHTASTHMQTHRKEQMELLKDRVCGICGTNKTSTNRNKDKKTGEYYEYPDWRRNPLDPNMWVCRVCYNHIRYYKIKKW